MKIIVGYDSRRYTTEGLQSYDMENGNLFFWYGSDHGPAVLTGTKEVNAGRHEVPYCVREELLKIVTEFLTGDEKCLDLRDVEISATVPVHWAKPQGRKPAPKEEDLEFDDPFAE